MTELNQQSGFDRAVHEAREWVDDVQSRLGAHREQAYSALLAGLHACRDAIDHHDAVHVGNCLPILLRGCYFEGWRPENPHSHARSRRSFLTHIQSEMPDDPSVDPEAVARAVLAVIVERLPLAEAETMKIATPSDMDNLWPD